MIDDGCLVSKQNKHRRRNTDELSDEINEIFT